MYNCPQGCCTIQITDPFPQPLRVKRYSHKAGVFVYDPGDERVLLVQSRGQLWGLPKGTVEGEETSAECAIREVKEETGLEVTVTDFTQAIKIKNRCIYYYIERKAHPVSIQMSSIPEANDANGITWIKVSCLEECVRTGHIMLNQHTKIALKKFIGKTVPTSDFVRVKRKKRTVRMYRV